MTRVCGGGQEGLEQFGDAGGVHEVQIVTISPLSVTDAGARGGLDMFARGWQAGKMKKQAADQSFHDRRDEGRQRAEPGRGGGGKKAEARVSGGCETGAGLCPEAR